METSKGSTQGTSDSPKETDSHDDKKVGVTHAIRQRLNFTDERLWKRFSARRLEMIDTMELLTKKASEQEDEIKEVADSLRKEFEYPEEYFGDFDKLVRAAVQSVRRNRKRSSNSRRKDKTSSGDQNQNQLCVDDSTSTPYKRQKIAAMTDVKPSALSNSNAPTETASSDLAQSLSFVSEIAHLKTDINNTIFDLNYSKSKSFSPQDRSRAIMDNMIRPRVGGVTSFILTPGVRTPTSTRGSATPIPPPPPLPGTTTTGTTTTISASKLSSGSNNGGTPPATQVTRVGHLLPPLANVRINSSSELPNGSGVVLNGSSLIDGRSTTNGVVMGQTALPSVPYKPDVTGARRTLQRYMEASKTCSEDRGDNSNIRTLGKACIESGIAYLFAHLFQRVDGSLIEYLRLKLTLTTSSEKILKSMDPLIVSTIGKQDTETVSLTLNRIIGCCVKDFGFERILMPLCELIYGLIIDDYAAVLRNSVPFKATERLELIKEMSNVDHVTSSSSSNDKKNMSGLNSLATIATEQMKLEVNGCSLGQSVLMSRSTSPLMHSIVTEHNSSNNTTTTTTTTTSDDNDNNNNNKIAIQPPFGPFAPKKKKVILRFINRVIELEFPMKNAAPPRLGELIENARTAFNLNYLMSNAMWGVRIPDGQIITSDLELERIFFTENFDRIELEIFNQGSKTIPIYEITSTISSNPSRKEEFQYILPPPVASHNLHLYPNSPYSNGGTQGAPPPPPPPQLHPLARPTSNGSGGTTFMGDDRGKHHTRPQPMLPRFQRLL
ncbi:uncharacterized protein KQ657_002732 [Scheffersomyces spartinae]|uniref:Uncharacterized protein n=1 Tax=Scheffersomyces spartinae TaxID=45513 RepID=A0A9P7V5I5_9ASCO|nr:uncharacterized protein KQ657_002732 [Scheffersomyces spartinae]KAG7191767.1 hypothetical protein KQ657_002732 [Scheffersomyces spartinae]